MNDHDKNLVKTVLNEHSDALPAAVTTRLREARIAALEAAEQKSRSGLAFWAGGGLATACSILFVGILFWQHTVNAPSESQSPFLENMELFTQADDLEFYEEIEFYAWLAEQEQQG